MTPPLEHGELDAMNAGEPFTPGPTMQEILAKQAETAKKEPASSGPVLAQNSWNQAQRDGKPTAAREATKSPAPESRGVVTPDEPLVIEGGMFDHLADAPIEDVRAFVGTSRPELPAQYAEDWDEGLEREFLTFSANNQLPTQTVQRLLNWYAETSIVSSDMSREWTIAQFNETFADLPKPVRDKLVEFYLIDLLGDGGDSEK